MLIVIEGPDGAGKSTLQSRLAARMSGTVAQLHYGPPETHPLLEYENDVLKMIHSFDHVIIDRLHWGEPIYGNLYRGKSELGWAGFIHVELMLQALGGLIVKVTGPADELIRRQDHCGEDYIDQSHTQFLIDEYGRLDAEWAVCPRIETFDPSDDEVDAIVRHAEARSHDSRHSEVISSYLGSNSPAVLFLVSDGPEMPVFQPFPESRGWWFFNSFPRGAVVIGRPGFMSVYEPELLKHWIALGTPPIIAVGRTAQDRVTNVIGVDHAFLGSPNHDIPGYDTLIKQAMEHALNG